MAKKKTATNFDHDSANGPLFEDSLEQLQQIVTALEEGNQGLEESLTSFERGIGLLNRCYQLLDGAEQKIDKLTGVDSAGKPVTQPFDASATFEAAAKTVAGRRSRVEKSGEPVPGPAENAANVVPQETVAEVVLPPIAAAPELAPEPEATSPPVQPGRGPELPF
jgi:exodeoxyribonuclease VII small subunit